MRQTPIAVAVKNNVCNPGLSLALKTIAQAAHVFVALIHFGPREFSGHAKAYDVRDRFSPGATLAFLVSTNLLRENIFKYQVYPNRPTYAEADGGTITLGIRGSL